MIDIESVNAPKAQPNFIKRLFSIAAPIVGGIFGGPAGAAVGGMIGNKVGGEDSMQSAISGLGTYANSMGGKANPNNSPSGVAQKATDIKSPATDNDQFAAHQRKLDALSQDPQVGIAQGLDVLSQFPTDHPIRKELAPSLIQAQMMGQRFSGGFNQYPSPYTNPDGV